MTVDVFIVCLTGAEGVVYLLQVSHLENFWHFIGDVMFSSATTILDQCSFGLRLKHRNILWNFRLPAGLTPLG